MKHPFRLVIIVAVVILGAFMLVRAFDEPDTRDRTADAEVPATSAVPLAADDLTFLTLAARSGKAEIELAELAERTSEHARVDELADRIEREHAETNRELESLADRKKVDFAGDAMGLPSPTDEQQATHERLDKLDGTAFNRAWADQMVKDHQAAIDLFEKATASRDADVKLFAEKTLPALKEHLRHSQELQQSLTAAR